MWDALHQLIDGWNASDTWIVATAALAAMSCALPGNYLVLRRQSMMGDALSHSALLGVVLAFLAAHAIRAALGMTEGSSAAFVAVAAFIGAVAVGVLTAIGTEGVRNLGRVESSAALGVVFTTLFALGVLLVTAAADEAHIDLQCVLLGEIVSVTLDTSNVWGFAIPRAALSNGAVLLFEILLVVLFYKELKISAFDPGLATTLGIDARRVNYVLMAVTAAAIVAAFRSVGSILVIAMLIVPPATAHLLTDRMGRMLGLSLIIAASSALLGHVAAIVVPPLVLSMIGITSDASASTAGMMAAASGCLFVLAILCGPRHGILSRIADRARIAMRIAADDLLGDLYRVEEQAASEPASKGPSRPATGIASLATRIAAWRLRSRGLVERSAGGYVLTPAGRAAGRELVRAHRLWESFMQKHFRVPEDHLHATAHRVEHYLDSDLRRELDAALNRPARDPHGREIPSE